MFIVVIIDLLMIGAIVAAGRRRLENALPVCCFFLVLLPLEDRIVLPGVVDLSPDRVALITLLVLFVAQKGYKKPFPIPLRHLILLHTTFALCSTLYSLSMVLSLKQLVAQVLEYYLLYVIFVKSISEVATVYRIGNAIAMAMGLCCIFGLFEAYAQWSVLMIFPSNLWNTYGRTDPLYIEWGRGLRVRSTFPHPILLGDALAMTIPLTLYLLSICKRSRQRLLLWTSLAFMCWGIYKTSSRGPWIALIMSCLILFLLVNNRVRRYLGIIGTAAVVVMLARPGILQTIVNLYEATQDTSNPVGSSYAYRDALTKAVTTAVRAEPGRMLLGYGLGTFREYGLDINFLDEVQHWYTCDNNWAAFLYETGYPGLILMVLLLTIPALMTLRSYYRLQPPDRHLCGVLFIAQAAFCFALLSVAGYSWGQQGFMAWIFIALSVAYPRVVVQRVRQRMSGVRGTLTRSGVIAQEV